MNRIVDACGFAGHEYRLAKAKAAPGYSLLEVILALAVLAGSGLAIQALIADGSRAGMRAEQGADALSLAQSLLDELAMDAGQLDGEVSGSFSQHPAWEYRARVAGSESLDSWGLSAMTVEVFPAGSARVNTARDTAPMRSARSCRLTRWVRRSTVARSDGLSGESAGRQHATGDLHGNSPRPNEIGGSP